MGIERLIMKIDNENLKITFKSRIDSFVHGIIFLVLVTVIAVNHELYFIYFFEAIFIIYLFYIKSKKNVLTINNQNNTINLQIKSIWGNLYNYTFEFNKPIEFRICRYRIPHKRKNTEIYSAILLSNHNRLIMFKIEGLNNHDYYISAIKKIDFKYCN